MKQVRLRGQRAFLESRAGNSLKSLTAVCFMAGRERHPHGRDMEWTGTTRLSIPRTSTARADPFLFG
jgi:hypothetical protein